MKRWPLFAVAACSLILIAVRIIWPLIKLDNTSLVLFGVAALAMLVAFLPIKRIKWGEFEAEIDRAVDDLERKVKATEVSSPTLPASKMPAAGSEVSSQPTWERFFDEYIALVNSPASNVEKIIAATVLLEKMIDTFATSLGLELGAHGRGPRYAIDRLSEKNLITTQEKAAFTDLWAVRNKIVHDGIRPTDEQTARLLDLVWRLVRTLA
jgi:uncharacterized protein YutE (UPF0331/DUF86 family)